ncbi:hypothetical protein [Rhodococcus gordoniae]|uniref:hypothetical protein n=1 Tax=Rhodococcus gordoniae TaxID=223392 RepID=UPI0035260A23
MNIQAKELGFDHLGKHLVFNGGQGMTVRAPLVTIQANWAPRGGSSVTVWIKVLDEEIRVNLDAEKYVQIEDPQPM